MSKNKKKKYSKRERSLFKSREPEIFNPLLVKIFVASHLTPKELGNESTMTLPQIAKSLSNALKELSSKNGSFPDPIIKISELQAITFESVLQFRRSDENKKGDKAQGIRFIYQILERKNPEEPFQKVRESQATLSVLDILNIIQKLHLLNAEAIHQK